MSGDGFADAEQAVALLGGLLSGVDQVVHGMFWRVGGDELLNLGRQLETLSRKVFAAQVRWAGEVDAQGLAASRSCSSTTSLLVQSLRISAADASLRVRAATCVLPQDLPSGGERPPRFPHLGAALDAGRIGMEHARTALATLRRLPEPVRGEAEDLLAVHASTLDPQSFDRAARHLELTINAGGDLDEPDISARMELTLGARNPSTGLTRISGHLDDLAAATVRTALQALAAPAASSAGVPDQRSPACRTAHALAHVCQWFLSHGDAPDTGGERPHLTVTIDYDMLNAQLGAAVLADGQPLSAGDTRRLACDAQILPAVLGGASEVLDVGRAQRTATVAIRRALALRDRGCAWPGCDRPPGWCDAHHIDWWQRDLGHTRADRMTLLCPYHHGELHKGEWTAVIADGRATFLPPAWIDPARSPLRNTVHDPPPGMRR